MKKHLIFLVLFFPILASANTYNTKEAPTLNQFSSQNGINNQEQLLNIVDSINENSAQSNKRKGIVIGFLKNYFDENYALEAKYPYSDDNPWQNFDVFISEKTKVFNKYWLLNDTQRIDYYKPMSRGGDYYNWQQVDNLKFFETGDDFKPQFLVTYSYHTDTDITIDYSYLIVVQDNHLKIKDFFLNN